MEVQVFIPSELQKKEIIFCVEGYREPAGGVSPLEGAGGLV